jgi:hypothetical protein
MLTTALSTKLMMVVEEFFFFMTLRVEFRALSHLNHSASPFCLVIFETGSCFVAGLARTSSSYLCFLHVAWGERHMTLCLAIG